MKIIMFLAITFFTDIVKILNVLMSIAQYIHNITPLPMKQSEKINIYEGMLENSTKFSQGLFAVEEHYLIASIKNNHIYIGY